MLDLAELFASFAILHIAHNTSAGDYQFSS